MNDLIGKTMRILGVVFLGLSGAVNLLGGIGTVCAAFLTEQFPSMMVLWDYRWLYQSLMIVTILIGLGGIWATIRLTKGGDNAYRNALILLLIGSSVGAVHYYASMTLRGSAAPANMKLYINVFTLLLFLFFQIPGIRERVDFDRSGGDDVGQMAGGLAAIMIGLVVISTSLWVGESHVYEGANWTSVLEDSLIGSGLTSSVSGVVVMLAQGVRSSVQRRKILAG